MAMRTILVISSDGGAIEAAKQTTADAVVLDMAQAVSDLAGFIASLKEAGKAVQVRLSPLASGRTRDDLAAVVGPGLDGVVLPKVEAPSQIRELDVLLREQEVRNQVRPGTVILYPQIESARGVLRCEDIVLASTRIGGLVFEGDIYASSLGVLRTDEGWELDYARSLIANCCAAYGLEALDGAYHQEGNAAGLSADAGRARTLGFKGKYGLSSHQIETIARLFQT
jgi:citrate lyase subunit beta/citryl-CoA lyase